MKIYFFITIALISIQLSAQNLEDFEQKLSISELQEDFKLLKSELEQKHPALYLYTDKLKLDSVFQLIQNSLNVEMDRIEFYRCIKKLNSTIKDAHTVIPFPQKYMVALKSELKRFPFRVYPNDDKIYLVENYSVDSSIVIGSEILSINNVSADELWNTMSEGISRDGYNLTYISKIIELYFSELYALNYGCPESFVVKMKKPSNSIVTKIVLGLSYNKELENGLMEKIKTTGNTPPISHQVIDKNIVVSIKSFSPSFIKGGTNIKYKNEFKKIFNLINDLNIERLIVDVRGNMGGHPEVADEFLSYLIPHEYIQHKSDNAKITKIENEHYYLNNNGTIKHFKKQKFNNIKDGYYSLKGFQSTQKPKKQIFTGEVIGLINGTCGSACGSFAGLIDEYIDATFIGQETGANKKIMCGGNTITLVLPHSKLNVNIPLRVIEINSKAINDGHGVIPDIPITPTITQKINGEDSVLMKALEVKISN